MKHVVIYGDGPIKEIMIGVARRASKKPVLVMIGDSDLKVDELLSYEEVYDGKKAFIIPELCDGCGECLKACQKGAITEDFKVRWGLCEGCPSCYYSCPQNAIDFRIVKSGEIKVYLSEGIPVVEYKYAPWINRYVMARHVRDIAKRLASDENSWILEQGWHSMPWALNVSVGKCDDNADLAFCDLNDLDSIVSKIVEVVTS